MLTVFVSFSHILKFYSIEFPVTVLGVGTRFVASVEAGAQKMHKELLLSAGFDDVARTVIYTGRPMRVRKTPYVADWYDHVVLLLRGTTDFFVLLGKTTGKQK